MTTNPKTLENLSEKTTDLQNDDLVYVAEKQNTDPVTYVGKKMPGSRIDNTQAGGVLIQDGKTNSQVSTGDYVVPEIVGTELQFNKPNILSSGVDSETEYTFPQVLDGQTNVITNRGKLSSFSKHGSKFSIVYDAETSKIHEPGFDATTKLPNGTKSLVNKTGTRQVTLGRRPVTSDGIYYRFQSRYAYTTTVSNPTTLGQRMNFDTYESQLHSSNSSYPMYFQIYVPKTISNTLRILFINQSYNYKQSLEKNSSYTNATYDLFEGFIYTYSYWSGNLNQRGWFFYDPDLANWPSGIKFRQGSSSSIIGGTGIANPSTDTALKTLSDPSVSLPGVGAGKTFNSDQARYIDMYIPESVFTNNSGLNDSNVRWSDEPFLGFDSNGVAIGSWYSRNYSNNSFTRESSYSVSGWRRYTLNRSNSWNSKFICLRTVMDPDQSTRTQTDTLNSSKSICISLFNDTDNSHYDTLIIGAGFYSSRYESKKGTSQHYNSVSTSIKEIYRIDSRITDRYIYVSALCKCESVAGNDVFYNLQMCVDHQTNTLKHIFFRNDSDDGEGRTGSTSNYNMFTNFRQNFFIRNTPDNDSQEQQNLNFKNSLSTKVSNFKKYPCMISQEVTDAWFFYTCLPEIDTNNYIYYKETFNYDWFTTYGVNDYGRYPKAPSVLGDIIYFPIGSNGSTREGNFYYDSSAFGSDECFIFQDLDKGTGEKEVFAVRNLQTLQGGVARGNELDDNHGQTTLAYAKGIAVRNYFRDHEILGFGAIHRASQNDEVLVGLRRRGTNLYADIFSYNAITNAYYTLKTILLDDSLDAEATPMLMADPDSNAEGFTVSYTDQASDNSFKLKRIDENTLGNVTGISDFIVGKVTQINSQTRASKIQPLGILVDATALVLGKKYFWDSQGNIVDEDHSDASIFAGVPFTQTKLLLKPTESTLEVIRNVSQTINNNFSSNVLNGTGTPSNDNLGVDGDLYIDSQTTDVWTKSSGVWTKRFQFRPDLTLFELFGRTSGSNDATNLFTSASGVASGSHTLSESIRNFDKIAVVVYSTNYGFEDILTYDTSLISLNQQIGIGDDISRIRWRFPSNTQLEITLVDDYTLRRVYGINSGGNLIVDIGEGGTTRRRDVQLKKSIASGASNSYNLTLNERYNKFDFLNLNINGVEKLIYVPRIQLNTNYSFGYGASNSATFITYNFSDFETVNLKKGDASAITLANVDIRGISTGDTFVKVDPISSELNQLLEQRESADDDFYITEEKYKRTVKEFINYDAFAVNDGTSLLNQLPGSNDLFVSNNPPSFSQSSGTNITNALDFNRDYLRIDSVSGNNVLQETDHTFLFMVDFLQAINNTSEKWFFHFGDGSTGWTAYLAFRYNSSSSAHTWINGSSYSFSFDVNSHLNKKLRWIIGYRKNTNGSLSYFLRVYDHSVNVPVRLYSSNSNSGTQSPFTTGTSIPISYTQQNLDLFTRNVSDTGSQGAIGFAKDLLIATPSLSLIDTADKIEAIGTSTEQYGGLGAENLVDDFRSKKISSKNLRGSMVATKDPGFSLSDIYKIPVVLKHEGTIDNFVLTAKAVTSGTVRYGYSLEAGATGFLKGGVISETDANIKAIVNGFNKGLQVWITQNASIDDLSNIYFINDDGSETKHKLFKSSSPETGGFGSGTKSVYTTGELDQFTNNNSKALRLEKYDSLTAGTTAIIRVESNATLKGYTSTFGGRIRDFASGGTIFTSINTLTISKTTGAFVANLTLASTFADASDDSAVDTALGGTGWRFVINGVDIDLGSASIASNVINYTTTLSTANAKAIRDASSWTINVKQNDGTLLFGSDAETTSKVTFGSDTQDPVIKYVPLSVFKEFL